MVEPSSPAQLPLSGMPAAGLPGVGSSAGLSADGSPVAGFSPVTGPPTAGTPVAGLPSVGPSSAAVSAAALSAPALSAPALSALPLSAARLAVGRAKVVVVKVGSSSLTTAAGGLDPRRLDALVDAVAGRVAAGSQVVLVSSGAIAAGLAPLGLQRRPRDLATQQAAASVGQQLLAERYAGSFARHRLTVGQILLTSDDVVRRAHYRNAQRTFGKLLSFGVVPVVNENDTVATAEIRFGDNDRLAALVANLVGAGALILLSDIDALYTGDPRLTTSVPVREVPDASVLDGIGIAPAGSDVGTGGMESKLTSALTATGAGIPVLLASAADAVAALRMSPVNDDTDGPDGRHRLRPGDQTDQRAVVLVAARRDRVRVGQPGQRCRRRGGEPAEVVAAGRNHRLPR